MSPQREKLLAALRETARLHSPRMPDLSTVAAHADVSVEEVREHLGPPENFAALLSYQGPVQDTRDRIIASAARVFAEKGFQRSSLDAVAADAGMTKGAIYWHFKNKNDLFFALLDDRFRRDTSPLFDGLAAMVRGGGDIRAQLGGMFEASLRRCTDDPEWARLYLECLSLGRNDDVRERLAAFYEQIWSVSAGFTRELQSHGLAPDRIDPQVAAVFWGALFDGLILAWLIKGDDLGLDRLLPAIFDLVWRGIAPDAPQASPASAPANS